ncbi:MAG: hypothetical protein NWP98_08515 [Erythrobacter sp.]|nr:hypothetical protein [Erythrobacter sp.]
MKFAPLAALGLVCAAITAPAMAQSDTLPDAPMAAAFTIDTPIEALMADARAKAVVLASLPGIDQHPAYDQFKAISLKAVAPFSQGLITEDVLAKIAADLAAIK